MRKNFETFGNYILLEKLAAGGMAEVYLAKKTGASGIQKFVAVKRILQQFSDSQDFITMFKDEAKIAINLSHSNVVSIYDFGIEKQQFYLVMEFVEGRNLRQILNRMKRVDKFFSIAQVVHIIKQVAAGLDHAHRCIDPTTGKPLNIIHRDMSPQNVMLGFEGDSKIVDFGIAKAAHQLEATRAGTLKGKFGYMSPEQVEGQVVDSRTDLFAMGIMAWEMLANQRLFLANSEVNTLRKIRECEVPSLRKINPNIPAELDQIIRKMLEKDRLERYQSAGEIHRDMQGFLSRFDPDFSVQDLSHFIKSLFSEEIIQIRKKQIVYSQVTVQQKNINEKTQLVETANANNTSENHVDEISLKSINFEKLRMGTGTGKKISGDSMSSFAVPSDGEDSLNEVTFDDGQTRRQNLRVARRDPDKLGQKTQTNIETNSNTTLFTLLFSLSFLLVFFAYVNKYHPQFKVNFCKSMEAYQLCPRTFYIPRNYLKVVTAPPGATLYFNGKKQGESPIDLMVKSVPLKIQATLPGYRTQVVELQQVPKMNQVTLKMQKILTGYIIINSVGVEIYINGLLVPSGRKQVVPANRNINVRVVNPISGQTKTEVFQVAPDKTIKKVIEPPS